MTWVTFVTYRKKNEKQRQWSYTTYYMLYELPSFVFIHYLNFMQGVNHVRAQYKHTFIECISMWTMEIGIYWFKNDRFRSASSSELLKMLLLFWFYFFFYYSSWRWIFGCIIVDWITVEFHWLFPNGISMKFYTSEYKSPLRKTDNLTTNKKLNGLIRRTNLWFFLFFHRLSTTEVHLFSQPSYPEDFSF